VLRSRNLVDWQEMAGAMGPQPDDYPCYWAPEVTYDNGRFYLYYSVGDEATMHIRVATATAPAGPFTDHGVRLTQEPFAIDAHVFVASDGRRYLFYATDFLEHERVGTGTVMDRLLDPFTLAGQPRPVSRAYYDWQIYDPSRAEKGGACWHTLEGPFVLERKGLYYQMFSGGNWQNPSYGVGYAVSPNLDATDEWQQACDGERVLPILRTIPGRVIGPGHNSVVRGPDNRQLFCVYHRWGSDGRQLAIDPLDWAGDRLLVLGPSHTPQIQTPYPTFADFFDGPELDERWQVVSGRWQVASGDPTSSRKGTEEGTTPLPNPLLPGERVRSPSLQEGLGEGALPFPNPLPQGEGVGLEESAIVADADPRETAVLSYDAGEVPFLAEVSARALSDAGSYGLGLSRGAATLLRLCLRPAMGVATLVPADGAEEAIPLPPGFCFDAFHLLRVEVDSAAVILSIDDRASIRRTLAQPPTGIALFAENTLAAFAGFALTVGWQDCFESETNPGAQGWESDRSADWTIRAGQVVYVNSSSEGFISNGPYLREYNLVVNARLDDSLAGSSYGIAPALTKNGEEPLLSIERAGAGWVALWTDEGSARRLALPDGFDPAVYQQFRFRKENGRLIIYWEQHEIASMPVTLEATRIGLYSRAGAAFDMVRVTAVPPPDRALLTRENT
jgi:GH43 family beta-xylosidase